MKIGIIGNGKHSKKIQHLLKKKNLNFYIYKAKKPSYFNFKDFENLKKCQVIFILSPNNTHYNYIRKLYNGKRYIFCEKPPTTNRRELSLLKSKKYNKIYFNFNYRFSVISSILRKQKNLDDLIYANITLSHGYAFKKEYKYNWRSNKKDCRKGIYEMLTIHFIDLINFLFKIKKIRTPNLFNISKKGNSYDTASVEIILKNNAIINIFNTYNAPYSKKLFFLFKNKIIEQIENNITIKNSFLNFDKNKNFKPPKIIKKIIDKDSNKSNFSLEMSLNYFLETVKKKRTFSKKILKTSLETNRLILK
jgi:predicted dehydrogenase